MVHAPESTWFAIPPLHTRGGKAYLGGYIILLFGLVSWWNITRTIHHLWREAREGREARVRSLLAVKDARPFLSFGSGPTEPSSCCILQMQET